MDGMKTHGFVFLLGMAVAAAACFYAGRFARLTISPPDFPVRIEKFSSVPDGFPRIAVPPGALLSLVSVATYPSGKKITSATFASAAHIVPFMMGVESALQKDGWRANARLLPASGAVTAAKNNEEMSVTVTPRSAGGSQATFTYWKK